MAAITHSFTFFFNSTSPAHNFILDNVEGGIFVCTLLAMSTVVTGYFLYRLLYILQWIKNQNDFTERRGNRAEQTNAALLRILHTACQYDKKHQQPFLKDVTQKRLTSAV